MRALNLHRCRPLLLGLALLPAGWSAAQERVEPNGGAPTAPSTGAGPVLPGTRPPSADAGGNGEAATRENGGPWQVAPIRWDGNVLVEARSVSYASQPRRLQLLELLNLRAASYLWQPWFVQVNGSLSLGLSRTSGRATETDFGGEVSDESKSRAFNATLGMAVFPQSRFPFNGTWSTTDSRTSDAFSSSDSRAQRLSLRQGYRNEAGDTSYTALYDRSELTGNVFGRDRVDVIQGLATRRLGDQQFDVIGVHSRNERSSDGGGSSSTRLSLSHSFRRDEDLFVSSTLSDTASRLRVGSGPTELASRLRFRQFNTLATWTPDLPQPVLVTGSLRWADTSSSNQTGETERVSVNTSTYSAAGTVTWRPTRNLQVGGAISLSRFSTDGLDQSVGSESLSIGYTLDPRQWLGFNYLAGTNASVNHQHGGLEGSRLLTTESLNHSVMRSFTLSESMSWGVSLNQTLALRQDTVVGNSQTLAHNAGVNLRYLSPEGTSGYASLSVGDSNTTGYTPNRFRMVNLQTSGQIPFGRYSAVTANLTAQMVRQQTELQPDDGWRRFMTGGVTYQHGRLFGVPRLRYTALANAYNAQVSARINGDPNAPLDNVQWTHEQRLEYTVGRLDVRLSARLTKVDGKKNALVFLRVSRSFGAF